MAAGTITRITQRMPRGHFRKTLGRILDAGRIPRGVPYTRGRERALPSADPQNLI